MHYKEIRKCTYKLTIRSPSQSFDYLLPLKNVEEA